MRRLALIPILLLLGALLVTATTIDEQYIVALSQEDGVEGVIVATELAAWMQANADATFTAIADYNVMAADNLEGKVLIFLKGESATIVAPSSESLVTSKAKRYLYDKGYDVEEKTLSELASIESSTAEDEEPETPAEERTEPEKPACDGCLHNGECLLHGTVLTAESRYCDETGLSPLKETGALCANSYECRTGICEENRCVELEAEPPAPAPAPEEAPKQNVVVRFFNWIASLFG